MLKRYRGEVIGYTFEIFKKSIIKTITTFIQQRCSADR